jgi:carbon storage regulator
MLVLTRKTTQSIMIGDDIEITVLAVGRDGKVRIGITAPKTVSLWRKEVYLQLRAGDAPAVAAGDAAPA